MKKSSACIVVLLVVAVLHGCYSPAPTPPPQQPRTVEQFTIELKVDKPVYRIGDDVIIIVRVNRDCYLSLYNVSTLGEVTQIFPNRFAGDNLIQKDQVYRIPAESDTFDFAIEGPPGIERVRAVGTMANVNFFEPSAQTADEDFPSIGNDPKRFDQTVDQKLETMSAEQWAEASVTYKVEQ